MTHPAAWPRAAWPRAVLQYNSTVQPYTTSPSRGAPVAVLQYNSIVQQHRTAVRTPHYYLPGVHQQAGPVEQLRQRAHSAGGHQLPPLQHVPHLQRRFHGGACMCACTRAPIITARACNTRQDMHARRCMYAPEAFTGCGARGARRAGCPLSVTPVNRCNGCSASASARVCVRTMPGCPCSKKVHAHACAHACTNACTAHKCRAHQGVGKRGASWQAMEARTWAGRGIVKVERARRGEGGRGAPPPPTSSPRRRPLPARQTRCLAPR